MEIKLTDEQVERMVKQTVEAYVMNKLKGKIDKVMKDNYHFHQSIANAMRDSVNNIMREKIDGALSNSEISVFFDPESITQSVTDAISHQFTKKVKEAIQDIMY